MTLPEEKRVPDREEPSQPASAQPEAAPLEPAAEPVAKAPAEGQIPPFPVPETEPEFDFPRMADDVEAFRRQLQGIEFKPAAVRNSDEHTNRPATPRRRRRNNRLIQRPEASELGERLASIAERASPTIDFFIFAFLAGCVLAMGYILNSPAILLLGIVVAPLLAPWVGAMLSASTGELRFLGQTIGAFFTVIVLVFLLGVLGGFTSRLFQPMDTTQALLHASLWWPDLLLLILGTTILVVSFIQSEEKPVLASLLVAYEFFLPVSAAGFGLGSGVDGLWPQAGLVFLVHLAISLIISLMVFFYMGFKPLEAAGYFVTIGAAIASLVFVAGFFGFGTLLSIQRAEPTATPELLPTSMQVSTAIPTPSRPPTKIATITPLPPTEPPTVTPVFTETPTAGFTPTLLPTPVYGRVQAEGSGDGAVIRVEPGGTAITTVQNGYLVEFLPVDPVVLQGETWVKVLIRTPTGDKEGWVLLRLILTATPSGSP